MSYQNVVPNQLGQAAITLGATTIYTVPNLTRTFVKDIDIANTTGSAINATVYLVPSASIAGTANTLVPTVSIPANSIFQWTGSQVLLPGGTIQVQASALGLTITASGGEAT